MREDIGKVLRAIIHAHSRYTPKRNRNHWYVDGTNGVDQLINQQGRIPDRAFATWGYALIQCAAGDCLHIAEGSYDEAISIPAGLAGLEVICEPGVILSNTVPGTVVSIAAPNVKWTGGILSQAAQIGMAVTGRGFTGIDIAASNVSGQGCATSFDIDAADVVLIRCTSASHTVTAFDIGDDNGYYEKCRAFGVGAVRGFYLSNAASDSIILYQCTTLNCTAGGYELVAGADNNVLVMCAQSELCGGPIDAGANNSWINHLEESQIAVGNTQQQDLADIHTLVSALELRALFYVDYWSDPQEVVTVAAAAGTLNLPDVTVADLTLGTVVRAIAMFKAWSVENSNVAANAIDGATVASTSQVIQVRDDTPGTWRDAINIADDEYTLPGSTVGNGDVRIGSIDIAIEVDGNDTYEFRWLQANADVDNLEFHVVQTGLRVWYSV